MSTLMYMYYNNELSPLKRHPKVCLKSHLTLTDTVWVVVAIQFIVVSSLKIAQFN